MKRTISFFIILFILGGGVIQAQERPNVEIEILVHDNQSMSLEQYIENIVLNDGTHLSDYSYSVSLSNNEAMSGKGIEDYFSFAAWVRRGDEITLSLNPTRQVRWVRSVMNSAWDTILSPETGFYNHEYWDNTQVMEWQFFCHFDFSPTKEFWNIEPHRIADTYLEVVLSMCNP